MTTTDATTIDQALEGENLTPATRRQIEEAAHGLERLQGEMTQRDWLQVTRALDRTRQQITEDGGLRLLALLWVKEKNTHGGADWNRLLDLTDEALLEAHGFPTDDDEEPADQEAPRAEE